MEELFEIKPFFEAFEAQSVVKAEVLDFTGKGFNVDVFGVKCYLPGSQLARKMTQEESSSLVGKIINVTILKLNPFKNNVIVSQKSQADKIKAETKNEAFSKLTIGDVITGTVKAFATYGVFVNLGAIDGLIMMRDLSYSKVSNPNDIVEIGQKINVKVIDLDNSKGTPKVNLSLKALKDDPWMSAQRYISIGDRLSCKVTDFPGFGVFLETPFGISGLLHKSAVRIPRGSTINDLFSKGEIVDVIVDDFQPDKRKLIFVLP